MASRSTSPDLRQRLGLLGNEARHEVVDQSPAVCNRGHAQQGAIYNASCGGGHTIPLLKTLLTSRCTGGCRYCAIRSPRDVRRATATPDEMARTFEQMLTASLVRGIFLSSGIYPDAITAMDRLIDTAAILRRKLSYRGYLHLKVLPGAEAGQVEAAARLSSRISVNLEAPTRERVRALAPGKSTTRLLRDQLDTLGDLARHGSLPRSGWTTQFVVGPAGESDGELLRTSERLYRGRALRRAYYSRFDPVAGTPLEGHEPTATVRQHRLYQADSLMRWYGFTTDELCLDDRGNLPTECDPKAAWAVRHPERFPVEVNEAEPPVLLRVPGLGPKAVRRIVQARREGRIDDVTKLRQLGASPRRCAGFVTLVGKLLPPLPVQQDLFGGELRNPR